jgi:hypothetical protein
MNKEIDKIRKLLKLSESPNIHEAQKAMAKAQELAYKSGIKITEVTDEEETIISKSATKKRTRTPIEEREIASILANNFRVKVYQRFDWNDMSTIIVIGLSSDVELFQAVFSFAIQSYRILKNRFLSEFKSNHPRIRKISKITNTYLFGFLSGLKLKFRQNVEKYALTVTAPDCVEDALHNLKLAKGKQGREPKFSMDATVWNRGYTDGKTVEIHKSLEGKGEANQ